jgi:hypothetical protein
MDFIGTKFRLNIHFLTETMRISSKNCRLNPYRLDWQVQPAGAAAIEPERSVHAAGLPDESGVPKCR